MNIPPYGNNFISEGAVLSTLKASAHPVPDMTIHVTEGGFWLNGKNYIEYSGGSSSIFIIPSANAKWSILYLNSSGYLQIANGTPSIDPQLPITPRNSFIICFVYLQSTDIKITKDMIFDGRQILSTQIFSHKDLNDRLEDNQHSISAVTNLVSELDDRPTQLELSNILLSKADQDGSDSLKFTMNKDFTGTPSSDILFEVERGSNPNVSIRYNETLNGWDFNNDGTGWTSFQPKFYISDELTGTGTEEVISHGLPNTPNYVFVTVTDTTSGTYTIIEGIHDGMDIKLTITSGIKYKIMAY